MDFTYPDAEATPFPARRHAQQQPEDVVSQFSDSGSSNSTPSENDTGLFWQNSMPQVYDRQQRAERPRPQRAGKRAMELSELLDLHKTSSPAKVQQHVHEEVRQARHSPLHMRPVVGKIETDGTGGAVVSSPLRRSLLKSSKLGGSPVGKPGVRTHVRVPLSEEPNGRGDGSTVEESWASKASDQRQLLRETVGAQQEENAASHDGIAFSAEHTEATVTNVETSYITEEEGEITQEPSRSYEEHLNVESPQKIKVKFGDSLSGGNSSLLAPKREYAPLFAPDWDGPQWSRKHAASPPTITLVPKNVSGEQQPGMFSRLSTTFWSAVVRPTGPAYVLPSSHPQSQSKPKPQHAQASAYPPALRTHIRSRYGVLASTHPWTFAHMRTLHRMLNSCTSGMPDTIIPAPGTPALNIPPHLKELEGTEQRSLDGQWRYEFSAQHALIVHTFFQVLVDKHIVEAMENGEVEELGDKTAREYRRVYGGRRGEELVWTEGSKVNPPKGSEIDWKYVVGALGNCEGANVDSAELDAREEREREEMGS